jgi:isoquinoline 1-oxidoreductase beta subunit
MLRYIQQTAALDAATPADRFPVAGSAGESGSALITNVSRRGFLKGAGLVLSIQMLPAGVVQAFRAYPTGAAGMPHKTVTDPLVFVKIGSDGTVTLVAHRAEMGTGSRTNVPMVLADEMEASWAKVRIVQAPGDEPRYGNQDTDGSRSLRHFVQPMRQCGASMRLMLERAAAKQWGVDPARVRAVNHAVVLLDGSGASARETGRRLGYGELAKAAMAEPVPAFEELRFKKESEFRYIGKGEVPMIDLHDITTGHAVYGADVRLPGMKYAVVARPPVIGGKVKSFDATQAQKVPGVERIVALQGSMPPAKFAPLGGIAVVARSTWAALEGRKALIIEWEDGPHASFDTESYRKEMSETARKPAKSVRKQGDPDGAFSKAVKVVAAEYYQPHMVHTPMEPPAAIAHVRDGKAEIWGPVQSPYGTRQDVAKTLDLDESKVTVNQTLLGGGFGRKSKCDFVLEAALLSREVGAPVLVQWSREDDIRHGFNHTSSVERLEAAVDAGGKVVGWRHRSVAPSIASTFAEDSGEQMALELGMGLVDLPFEVPNIAMENGKALAHTRIGWFRAVSNLPRAFATQSFVGELAHELGKDQKTMLLELIGSPRKLDLKEAGIPELWNYGEPYDEFPIDTARLSKVVELAAANAGWGRQLPKGEALGIAAHRSFVSYVASVVHVKVADDGSISVPEVFTAIDCGFCINPERVRAQMEGAAVMGMTMALYSGLNYVKGRVEQSNFHDYQMARMNRYPENVSTTIVEHPFEVHATGVGEPGLPPFAPALANAIFAATGKRLRSLPFGEKVA